MGIVEFELECIVCIVIVYRFLHLLYPFHTFPPLHRLNSEFSYAFILQMAQLLAQSCNLWKHASTTYSNGNNMRQCIFHNGPCMFCIVYYIAVLKLISNRTI